ncbi:unnamed protein product [Nesidiocoris tenuis]|uniref:Cyclic nucleotide-binding domain-containing protein n=1 Tax=Nesidiocoris tenuis TaxID=355587 RepID=A0A6H5H8Q3_9HEMI|nr:unnamed protein product [Nesidiocoris tenuis]
MISSVANFKYPYVEVQCVFSDFQRSLFEVVDEIRNFEVIDDRMRKMIRRQAWREFWPESRRGQGTPQVLKREQITERTVQATSATDKNNQQLLLSSLKPGDYFGELALLTHHPRAANATAETDVVLAFLNVEAFERLLGSCDAIMRRNVKTYENQMKKLFKASEVPRIRK